MQRKKKKKSKLTLRWRRRKLVQIDHPGLFRANPTHAHAPVIPLNRADATREPLTHRARRQRKLRDCRGALAPPQRRIDPPTFRIARRTTLSVLRPPRMRQGWGHKVSVRPEVVQRWRGTPVARLRTDQQRPRRAREDA